MKKFIIILFVIISQISAQNTFINNYVFFWIDRNPKIVEQYLLFSSQNPDCAYILGKLYLGETSEYFYDLQKANYFLTLAANQNHPAAINAIGDGYYSGDIRKKNLTKALEFYEKSAKLGFGPGQLRAGIVLVRNGKTAEELERSIFWLDKASKNFHDLGEVTKAAKKYKEDVKRKLKNISRF